MNLYLLFAIAFGAMTGVADITLPRERSVSVIHVRAEKRAAPAIRRSRFTVGGGNGQRQTANGEPATASSPLTGAITPRAPALNG